MPINDLDDLKKLAGEFKGRVSKFHESHTEFFGKPTVLIPSPDSADVSRALQLVAAAGKRVFVRSGGRVSATDVSPADGVVLSMEAFKGVETAAKRLKAGVAATIGDLAEKLADDVFLPLGDNPSRSIASAVLSSGEVAFPRSTQKLALRDAVIGVQVVEADANAKEDTLDAAAFAELLAGKRKAVMTNLALDSSRWDVDAAERWMLARMCAYDLRSFSALCDHLFTRATIATRVDLSVRVTSGALDMRLVIVRATGQGAADRASTEAAVDRALRETGCTVLDQMRADTAGDAVRAWVATGPGETRENEVHFRFGSTEPRPFEGDFRAAFLEAVDFSIGADASGHHRAPEAEAWAELRLAPTGGVDARAHVGEVVPGASDCVVARRKMALAMPVLDATEATLRAGLGRLALRGRSIQPTLMGFDAFSHVPSAPSPIPQFRGDVLARANTDEYLEAIEQYASSSYSISTQNARMSPGLIAFPLDAADVERAVTFAATQQPPLRVVARSGGHQYCGLSSGGTDTLVLDLSLLDRLDDEDDYGMTFFPPGPGVPTQVTVKPGVRLEDLSPALAERGVLIPHGECPLVNIGGHVQTGGVGHQLRSFGVALDHVLSFKMVTREPNSNPPVYRERTFHRPTTPADPNTVTDDDVFRAVLGGGPGSWGVLTEVTFSLVDGSAETTYGRSEVYLYDRDGLEAAMEGLRSWVEQDANGTLPPGVDLFVTVLSGSLSLFGPWRPKVLLIEAMALDSHRASQVDAVFDEIRRAMPLHLKLPLTRPVKAGLHGAAAIADAGVRERGTFGMPSSGREFDLPYKKSLHLSRSRFARTFPRDFANLVESVIASGLKVVFQAVVGRGAAATQGRDTTHMQRRDALAQVVFDVFHESSRAPEAVAFQQQMKALLPAFSGGRDERMFWGTFEDAGTTSQLDMSTTAVQDLYFDTPGEYQRLQAIKRYTDPDDVFRTIFTVRP
jgi:FAD/FMN-containing dehydrogenase